MSFSHADVENIIKLLDASHFDELLLEVDGVKLQLRRNGASGGQAAGTTSAVASPSVQPSASAAPVAQQAAPVAPATPASAGQAVNEAGLLEIRAPMLGTFYSCPKPGADPFVSVGSRVEADTVVGIIEVMKLMNSTSAGISGEVVQVLVSDGDLVEYDQLLMRVRP